MNALSPRVESIFPYGTSNIIILSDPEENSSRLQYSLHNTRFWRCSSGFLGRERETREGRKFCSPRLSRARAPKPAWAPPNRPVAIKLAFVLLQLLWRSRGKLSMSCSAVLIRKPLAVSTTNAVNQTTKSAAHLRLRCLLTAAQRIIQYAKMNNATRQTAHVTFTR